MIACISEIQITQVMPREGLVAFASFVLNESFRISSVGIYQKMTGGFRLTYPTRKTTTGSIHLIYPISREVAVSIEEIVIKKYEEVLKQYDRYNRSFPEYK